MDKIKCISYGSVVGLLIEAITEQQTQIYDFQTVLIRKIIQINII